MNRFVQILLLAALLPLSGIAEEETLEERKKRITRKYMRQRMTLSQSDMEVPSLVPTEEEEQVLESEQYKNQTANLQRDQGESTPLPPMRRPMPRPQEEERNWLLQGMEDEEQDPYADPFGRDKSEDSKSDYWSSRKDRTTGESRYGSDRSRNPYERQSYNPYDTRSRYSQSYLNSGAGYQQSETRSLYGSTQQQESRYGSREQWRTSGQQQERSTTPGTSLYSSRTYGSTPQSGMLQYPSTSSSTDSTYNRSGTTRERQQGYQPYVSPYQTRREERTSPWQTTPRTETKEYKPSNTVQEWKDRNKSWDPAKTQDYMDEMMRRDSR